MSPSREKICFVIMGFGKKKDPETNRTIDLDVTYKKIIQPAVIACKYTCIRADEICESGMIDRSMYALLYKAELVIADISTYNPNAIYELGIRHTFKPYSTIVIKEDESKIPFDVNHIRTLNYKHLGNEISDSEAKKCVSELKSLILKITSCPAVDSPLYTFIPQIQGPNISEEDINHIVGELASNENTIYSLMEKSKEYMREERFVEAAAKWSRLSEMVQNEAYFVQQWALCTYKSKYPSELKALTDALTIIERISSLSDTETLGITGAINKNLWKSTHDIVYLDTAIEYYKKGWSLYKDYYTGENYAQCIEYKALETGIDPEERTYYKIEGKKTRESVITVILKSLEVEEPEEVMWKYATLSNCYRGLGNESKATEYEYKFIQCSPKSWEISTFNISKKEIEEYLISNIK